MIQVQAIDTRGLEEMISGLRNALVGTGGDCSAIVKDESRLLATEISKRVGPKDRSKTAKRIEASVRSRIGELSETTRMSGKSASGVVWYAADPNFLYGVKGDMDARRSGAEKIASVYFHSAKIGGKTRVIYPFKHPRKKQMAAIKQRIVTSPSTLRKAARLVQKGIGKLRASWFATAKKIEPSLVGPAWIERHIKNGKTTKSISNLSNMNSGEKPSVTFGSQAAGAGKFRRVVDFSVNLRQKKVTARLKLVLSGYSQDVSRGIRPRKRGKETRGNS